MSRINRSRYAKTRGNNASPPVISLKVCRAFATMQGLAVYRLPHGRSALRRRYAVGRADLGVQAPFHTYVGLRALWAALQYPEQRTP